MVGYLVIFIVVDLAQKIFYLVNERIGLLGVPKSYK